MISTGELFRFMADGAVTLDTPFAAAQVTAASTALNRLVSMAPPGEGGKRPYRSSTTCNYFDPELLDLIQHPFLEEVACSVLRAEAVVLLQTAVAATYPQPTGPFTFDQHIDLQYTRADLEASPRRIVCSFFVWLSDVTETRAPMMYRPESHRLLARHWEQAPDLRGRLPRVQGVPMADLPDLTFTEPQPLLAKAGQVSVLTTAMVHGASVNLDRLPRKAMIITFTARDVTVELPPAQQETKDAYEARLLPLLRQERRHILRSQA